MGNPFFSIVMPVYQVERYIKQAIDCVLRQTFPKFELILVDDCSTDRSGTISENLKKSDDRIQVVRHEKNRGLSAARNTGMELAVGQYILFWDADDEVDDYILEQIYSSIVSNPAQVIVYGLIEEYYNKEHRLLRTVSISMDEMFLENREQVHKVIPELESRTLYGYAWNKCYDLGYLRGLNLKFESIKMIEDIKFNVAFCQNIDKMNILNSVPYHYKKRMNNSLTRTFLPDYYVLHRERIRLVYGQYQSWRICDDSIKTQLGNRLIRYIYSALERNCDKRQGLSFTDRKQWLELLYRDSLFRDLIPYAHSKRPMLKIMYGLLKAQCTLLCLMCGRIIYIVKNKTPLIFIILQQKG